MEITFNNQDNKDYQKLLNNLLKEIFIDFRFWYDLNLWDENYESYSIIENGEMIANICVYKTNILLNNKQYPALSVGAVATKKEHRGKGLSRQLMEHIIEKYDQTPMYLSANEDVIHFYPQFGFKRIYEKLPVSMCRIDNEVDEHKLSFDDPKVWHYVFNRINYSTKLDCLNTASINIFHLYWGYLKDEIYDLPELETIIVAKQEGSTLKIKAVFSLKTISFSELKRYLPFKNVDKIEFGFSPDWDDLNFTMEDYETDPLFVRGVSSDLGDFKFPELSIT